MSKIENKKDDRDNVKGLKNPLAICLSIIIRNTREKLNLSQAEIARRSNMTPSYIKSFESSNAILHIARAYDLYQGFKIENKEEIFTLTGLVEIIAMISILESGANVFVEEYFKKNPSVKTYRKDENRAYAQGLKKTASELIKSNYLYNRMLLPFLEEKIFDIEDTDWIIKTIEANGLYIDMEVFLKNPNIFFESAYKDIQVLSYNYIKELPSSFMDAINETNKNYSFISTRMNGTHIQKWEYDNRFEIEEMFYVFPVPTDSLLVYDFYCIYFPNCKKVTLYIIGSELLPYIKEYVRDRIFRAGKINFPDLSDDQINELIDNKFHVVYLDKIEQSNWPVLKESYMNDRMIKYSSYVFLMKSKLPVGFLGIPPTDESDGAIREEVTVLTIEEVNSFLLWRKECLEKAEKLNLI